MKTFIYDWVRNIVFYQLIVSITVNMIPRNDYQKYIRFFLGMLFLVITIQPLFDLFHLTETMDENYIEKMWEQEWEENRLEIDLEQQEAGENDEVSKYGNQER